jgi:hypothetical protein
MMAVAMMAVAMMAVAMMAVAMMDDKHHMCVLFQILHLANKSFSNIH